MKPWKTRSLAIGPLQVGGDNPIRIQSMTTSPTSDVEATVLQIIRLADEGCEMARVTVQGMKEAKACEAIKNTLIQRGYHIPLVADIHFYPPAALHVVDFVDKVRINPGNFADPRATFKVKEYDDTLYASELQKIEDKFAPLVEKCILLKKALRIGTNHGSLSDRILNRYGDTPEGMVESAFEYARICQKMRFHNFLFSMKSSNPLVMIEAYRLLVARMIEQGWDYPLHLGVTEAGLDEEGRIKSAAGIGALLLDGIGDTIRVSLTEDPWQEIAPAKALVNLVRGRVTKTPWLKPRRQRMLPQGKIATAPLANSYFIELEGEYMMPPPGTEWIVLRSKTPTLEKVRSFFTWLDENAIQLPVLLNFTFNDLLIEASSFCGALLTDGMGDGVMIEGPFNLKTLKDYSCNLLQACRMRSFKTEFISCPGCGRTLFDLQEVTKRIRAKTAHLPGVKIAIMGCIVNGPGEMADADFGYVGSRPGQVDLYVGRTCVEKGIGFANAEERLISLIKTHGRWVEPLVLNKLNSSI